ncbi:MAG: ABC transporter permease subunit [Phycisphaerales bacterium]|nr:ABC transporter permease subunit [Phycisphaerales bacterium]
MKTFLAVMGRELSSLFRLPVGWIVIALYAFLTGVIFATQILRPGEAATMRQFFGVAGWLLIPVAPAISMRLFADEARSGTLETLMTSPVTDLAVVLGKFGGAAAFLIAMLAPTLVHVGLLAAFSEPRPDLGPIVAGYLSVLLLGMMFLAAGAFFSSLTSNQTLAFLASLFFLLFLLMVSLLGGYEAPVWLQGPLRTLAIAPRLTDFAKGVIDVSHVVFFLTLTGWFLVLTYLSLGSRRWR